MNISLNILQFNNSLNIISGCNLRLSDGHYRIVMSQHISKIRPQWSLATNFGLRAANSLSTASVLALNAQNNDLRVCLIKAAVS